MTTNAELKARQSAAVAQGVASKAIYAARADNAEIWDVEGRRYIDFAAGIAVTNTGHRHPKVMAAVAEQAQAFTHTCIHVSPYESYVELAERLNALAPGDFAKKTLFLSTGARRWKTPSRSPATRPAARRSWPSPAPSTAGR